MPEINDLIAFGTFLFIVATALGLQNVDLWVADFTSAGQASLTLARVGLLVIGTGILYTRL